MRIRTRFPTLVLLLTLATPLLGWADVHLVVWQAQPGSQKIILPRLETESPSQAVSRYLKSLQTEPGLESLRPTGFQLEPSGQARDLSPETPKGRPRMAAIANRFDHLLPDGQRIRWTLLRFFQAGADPYLVGLSADLGLNETDAADFRMKVSQNFSMLVSLGGDDVSPEVYGETNTFSKNTNLVRDRSELALVKVFKSTARGVFFGICRGHQMGAVADGHGLKQDLTQTGTGSTDYHINQKGKTLSELQTWHHIIFQDSLLARFLLGKTIPNEKSVYMSPVNSVHHQVVDPKDSAASQVVALDDRDATVEALQGKNNKSFSVQFHPEFPTEISGDKEFSSRGLQILRGIVSYSRLIRMKRGANSCQRVHSS